MNDQDLAAIASGFKTVIDEQVLSLRAQIADLRAALDDERQKSAAHRLFESEARQRLAKTLADAVGDAVVPTLRQLQQRTADLEKRAIV